MEKIQISSTEQKFNWGEFKVYGERRKTLRHKTEDLWSGGSCSKLLQKCASGDTRSSHKLIPVFSLVSHSLASPHFFGVLISTTFPVRVRRKSSSISASFRKMPRGGVVSSLL